jgi:hypothetical protein
VCLHGTEVGVDRLVPEGYTVFPDHLVLSGLCPKCS